MGPSSCAVWRRSIFRRVLTTILLTAAPLQAAAEDPRSGLPADYVHQQWHAADGLPQESVTALARSADGYLWVGTQDGLVRYDGSRFLAPRTPARTGPPSVYALAAMADGSVWVAMADGILTCRESSCAAVAVPGISTWGVIRCLLPLRDGSVLAGAASGLWRIRGGAAQAIPPADGQRVEIISATEDTAGGITVLTNRSLRIVVAGQLRDPEPEAPFGAWAALCSDADGTLWLGGSRGLWRKRDASFERVTMPTGIDGRVSALYVDTAGSLWIATDKGLGVRPSGPGSVVTAVSIDVCWGAAFAEDLDGGWWVGSRGYGLHRLTKGRAGVMGAREGLAGDYALAVYESRGGALWLGADGGFSRLSGAQMRTWRQSDGLVGRQPRAFHESEDGTIWIGTEDTICRLRGERLTCGVQGFDSPDVFAFEPDGEGGVWVGAGRGLYRIGPDGVARKNTAIPAGPGSAVVFFLLRTRDGALWVGGERTSVTRIQGGNARRFDPPEVPSSFFIAGLEDDDGTIWFGTAGAGVVRYREGRFSVIGPERGFPDGIIYAILPDTEGRMWMSSNRGVFAVARGELDEVADGRRATLHVDLIGLADGLRSIECNGTLSTAGLRARDGRLWFPTTQGMAVIDPDIRADLRPVPVVIEDVLADRKSVAIDRTSMVVPPGGGEVEIRFATLSFSRRSGTVPVRYRLEGFDEDWRVEAGQRTARYTNLHPGAYVFRVESGGVDGYPPRQATLAFTLRPKWYQNLWYQAAFALGLLVVGFVATAVSVRRANARRAELTRAVDDALSQVKVLRGMLPLCAWCRRVRSDEGYWQQIEAYVTAHSSAEFTHGICPSCASKLEDEIGGRG